MEDMRDLVNDLKIITFIYCNMKVSMLVDRKKPLCAWSISGNHCRVFLLSHFYRRLHPYVSQSVLVLCSYCVAHFFMQPVCSHLTVLAFLFRRLSHF